MSRGSLARHLRPRGSGLGHSWIWSSSSLPLSPRGTWPAGCPGTCCTPSNLSTRGGRSKAAFLTGGTEGQEELQEHKEALCPSGNPLKATTKAGTQRVGGRNQEKAPKSWSAGAHQARLAQPEWGWARSGTLDSKNPPYTNLWSWGSCSGLCAVRRLGSFPEPTAWGSRIPAGSPPALFSVFTLR